MYHVSFARGVNVNFDDVPNHLTLYLVITSKCIPHMNVSVKSQCQTCKLYTRLSYGDVSERELLTDV